MRIFILEDDVQRQNLFIQACAGHELTMAADCGKAVKKWKPPYDVICLDHDLGGRQMVDSKEENTGYRFVTQVMGQAHDDEETAVFVHSYNPDGARNMLRALHEQGWHCVREPFGNALLGYLQGLK